MKSKIIHAPDLSKAASRRKEQTVFDILKSEHLASLTEMVKGWFYYIKTYGCQANVRDEETMRGMLEGIGCQPTEDAQKADIIIVNTCAVRENAEDKVYGEIGNIKYLRKTKPNLVLALCGCMVEQPEILDRVVKTFPEINLFFGTHEIPNLYDLLFEAMMSRERIINVESKPGEVVEELPVSRLNRFKAFVNIIYGCDKFCTYCIVPYTRGKERSRKFEEVIKECQDLVNQGYQEITLLGQNVNAYGKDLPDKKDFADMLEAVAKLGIPRLRFTTSHPWDFSEKMIDVIAKYPNIMKSIHLPVQSGSDEILRKMGRRYNREHYLNLVKSMREKIPGLTLSTDIIVGFPDETEEQFLETLSLVDVVKYESAFTFIYSPRKGTPAARMVDNVSKEIKTKRFLELIKHLEVSIEDSSKKMIGHSYDLLVDGVSKTDANMLSGYTDGNKLVHFSGDESMTGKIIKVRITESHTYSLIGEIVNGQD
ncbi:MAG: tRNA (N6-isopentenyl adenosine(37)-C2)-methylthiotransferase MiaB [Bacilli bacterium]|jgi:tRNA-2-methylthio-N6-dimethylallyladenosine synthase|nr:tRNA (N6-isopentenyl adenosine(37)-C2)-methylthiotransferase MiaB [Bacilli bacterium]MDD3068804.1 tRNA (N6-isopentenyl adenosine(37)-C2)-methylthiotransferase MiaB [Bacilli bacterium]MDD3841212.1 tRNA (N6-isopentenyl adenosine(37)-C2)-methylthiotransferase MiaB [Bacilli bacterium]HKM10061.1 tRNA (N6-isopentenyl adenosine(37)-C2)-methylthiotransferase MiaB [Bacilli bacterium]